MATNEENQELVAATLALAVRADIKAEALALYLLRGETAGIEGFRSVCREIAARYAETAQPEDLAAIYRQLAEPPKT